MLLCPWDFPGKTTRVGCHFPLQGIFPTQGKTCISCIGRWILYHWVTWVDSYNLCFLKGQFNIYHSQFYNFFQFRSITQSSLTLCWPNGLQHTRPPCPSSTPRVYSNSCPLSWWCHPTISFSVIPFSSCLQSFPASGSFPMSQFFTSGGQSIRVSASASVFPMNIQGWCPLGLTGFISLQSKGLSRVFANTKVQLNQFNAQPSL